MNSSEKDWKVSHIDAIFLLEVNLQLFDRERAVHEGRPGPMMLAIHDTQDLLLKPALCQWSHHPVAFLITASLESVSVDAMNQVTIQNPEDILSLLADVALRGSGFNTDCLLDYVLDEGFTEPIYLNASGEDPDAYFKGQSPAWAVYQIREWKRVLMISGGAGKERRVQITETP